MNNERHVQLKKILHLIAFALGTAICIFICLSPLFDFKNLFFIFTVLFFLSVLLVLSYFWSIVKSPAGTYPPDLFLVKYLRNVWPNEESNKNANTKTINKSLDSMVNSN